MLPTSQREAFIQGGAGSGQTIKGISLFSWSTERKPFPSMAFPEHRALSSAQTTEISETSLGLPGSEHFGIPRFCYKPSGVSISPHCPGIHLFAVAHGCFPTSLTWALPKASSVPFHPTSKSITLEVCASFPIYLYSSPVAGLASAPRRISYLNDPEPSTVSSCLKKRTELM